MGHDLSSVVSQALDPLQFLPFRALSPPASFKAESLSLSPATVWHSLSVLSLRGFPPQSATANLSKETGALRCTGYGWQEVCMVCVAVNLTHPSCHLWILVISSNHGIVLVTVQRSPHLPRTSVSSICEVKGFLSAWSHSCSMQQKIWR